jgi:hypothetical protein
MAGTNKPANPFVYNTVDLPPSFPGGEIVWLALLAKADVLSRICNGQAELLYWLDCLEES